MSCDIAFMYGHITYICTIYTYDFVYREKCNSGISYVKFRFNFIEVFFRFVFNLIQYFFGEINEKVKNVVCHISTLKRAFEYNTSVVQRIHMLDTNGSLTCQSAESHEEATNTGIDCELTLKGTSFSAC